MFTYTLAICSCIAIATAEAHPLTIGRIIIVGNTTVSDTEIRRWVNIGPGDKATPRDLRRAERSLAKLGVFELDPDKCIRPTITFIEAQGFGPRDLLIRVKEVQFDR